jgi:hypothetical protein
MLDIEFEALHDDAIRIDYERAIFGHVSPPLKAEHLAVQRLRENYICYASRTSIAGPDVAGAERSLAVTFGRLGRCLLAN